MSERGFRRHQANPTTGPGPTGSASRRGVPGAAPGEGARRDGQGARAGDAPASFPGHCPTCPEGQDAACSLHSGARSGRGSGTAPIARWSRGERARERASERGGESAPSPRRSAPGPRGPPGAPGARPRCPLLRAAITGSRGAPSQARTPRPFCAEAPVPAAEHEGGCTGLLSRAGRPPGAPGRGRWQPCLPPRRAGSGGEPAAAAPCPYPAPQ